MNWLKPPKRATGWAFACLALIFFILASQLKVGFFNGSVGPHHWAMGVSAITLVFCVFLIAFAKEGDAAQSAFFEGSLSRLSLVVLIIIYAQILPSIGYWAATIPLMIFISRLFGARWVIAVISSVAMVVVSYMVFDTILDVSLPQGLWWRAMGVE